MSRSTSSVLALCLAFGQADVAEQWATFKARYSKSYSDATEEQLRFGIFRRSVLLIEEENAKKLSYTLGVTEFADLTPEEFAARHLAGGRQEVASEDGYLGRLEPSGMDVPESLDWVEKGAVTGVKNQLRCGGCWAFSAMGAIESHAKINGGSLRPLSEQQLIDCDTDVEPHYVNKGCHGGWPSNAFMYAVNRSLCTEDSYGYAGKQQSCRAASCKEGLPPHTVLGFKDVAKDNEEALIEALQLGPVSVELNGGGIAFQFYHGGVINSLCGAATSHGVLVVGYAKDYFKIKNSWGSSWGEGGYVRLGRGHGGDGICGFLTAPNFPVFANTTLVV